MSATTWTSIVNATATGSQLEKTGGVDGTDDAGAITQSLAYYPIEIECTIGLTTKILNVGLRDEVSGLPVFNNIDVAFFVNSGGAGIEARNNGTFLEELVASYTAGVVIKLRVESDRTVKWYVNGVLERTSTSGYAPAGPLVGAASLRSSGALISSSTVTGDVPPGIGITIAGVNRKESLWRGRSVDLQYTFNGLGTLECDLFDPGPNPATAYRPSLDQLLVFSFNGVTYLNGTITGVGDDVMGDVDTGVLTPVRAVDKTRVLDKRFTAPNLTFAAGQTLKQIVSSLRTTYLAVYNITLDPGMLDGPTFSFPITFDLVTIKAAYNRLSMLSGWMYRLTQDDVLEWFAVGTKVAPFSLIHSNSNILGKVTLAQERLDFINRVWVRYGPVGAELPKQETFVGNDTQQSYPLKYNHVADPGTIKIDGEPILVGSGAVWIYTSDALQTSGTPVDGSSIVADYTTKFPNWVMREDASLVTIHGPHEAIVYAEEVLVREEAEAIGDARLRQKKVVPRTLKIETLEGPVLPGTVIPISIPDRLVSGNWLVTETHITDREDGVLLYTYTCLDGVEGVVPWLDFWNEVIGGGDSGISVFSGTITGGGIPNESGHFVSAIVGPNVIVNGIPEPTIALLKNISGGLSHKWQLRSDPDLSIDSVIVTGGVEVATPATEWHYNTKKMTQIFDFVTTSTVSHVGVASGALGAVNISAAVNPGLNNPGYGCLIQPVLNEHSSGTHAVFASLRVDNPTINVSGAATTLACTVYVSGAPTGTGGELWALYVSSGLSRWTGMVNTAAEIHTGVISPAQITANQTDYNPSGLSTARTLLLTSDAARDINSLNATTEGDEKRIINVGSNNITLKNLGAGSAANQFAIGADIVIGADQVANIVYLSSKWRRG